MITSRQIKAARGLLGWTQKDLADKCGFSIGAINRLEKGSSDPKSSTLKIIQMAFENEGIVLIDDEVFEGVKIRKRML